MNAYEMFKTDPELETRGVWLDYGEFRILVAYAGTKNTAYRRFLNKTMKPYLRQLEMDTLPYEKADALQREIFIQTIILGWEGVKDENGNELPFSIENARKLMTDLPALLKDIYEQSQKLSNFRAGEKAEIEKN